MIEAVKKPPEGGSLSLAGVPLGIGTENQIVHVSAGRGKQGRMLISVDHGQTSSIWNQGGGAARVMWNTYQYMQLGAQSVPKSGAGRKKYLHPGVQA